MPFVDGLELVEQAARLYPDMKAMIFSGYGEFEYARRAMRFGVEEYILKPVNPTEFQNAIKKIIRVLEESKQEKSRRQTEGSLFKEYIRFLTGRTRESLKNARPEFIRWIFWTATDV